LLLFSAALDAYCQAPARLCCPLALPSSCLSLALFFSYPPSCPFFLLPFFLLCLLS
jgi:hypothetical protein